MYYSPNFFTWLGEDHPTFKRTELARAYRYYLLYLEAHGESL